MITENFIRGFEKLGSPLLTDNATAHDDWDSAKEERGKRQRIAERMETPERPMQTPSKVVDDNIAKKSPPEGT